MKLDEFYGQIVYLIKEKKNQNEILSELIRVNGSHRGISARSLNRFISNNNLLNKVSDDELTQIVGEVVNRVGASFGR